MALADVLRKSFSMLLSEPGFFVPRLISSGLKSLILVGLFSGVLPSTLALTLFILTSPLGLFTLVMVSAMADKRGSNILRDGFHEALGLWKEILLFFSFVMFLGFVNALPVALGYLFTLVTGDLIFLVGGVVLSLLVFSIASFGFYFVPIGIVKNRSFSESLADSWNMSKENRRDVFILLVFSLVFLVFSSLSTGYLRNIGLLIYFVGSLVSSVVGTYFLVVSPNYYIGEKD